MKKEFCVQPYTLFLIPLYLVLCIFALCEDKNAQKEQGQRYYPRMLQKYRGF